MRFLLSILLSSCLLTTTINAQSLVQDTENLLTALQQLQHAPGDSNQFVIANATAQVLAILQSYDQSVLTDTTEAHAWPQLLDNYKKNTLITNALQATKFTITDTLSASVFWMYDRWKNQKQSGPRQKMLTLLHAEEVVAPRNYLSVANTLDKYKLPPVKNVEATRLAAQKSNANFNNGILNSTAVIQGMFEFVLDRAKDEVVINFLERMLNEDSPQFAKLFPTVVGQFSNKNFTYSNSFIERLRQAFYQDIQHMSVNLPVLMLEDEYFRPLQSEPIAYNFLALYSMVGMSLNDLPVEEIMPITHRYLYQSYEEAIKEVNFELADNAYDQSEYATVVARTRAILDRIKAIYLDLDNIEFSLREKVNAAKNQFGTVIPPPDANSFLQKEGYDLDILLGDDTELEYDLELLPSLLQGQLDSSYILGFNTLQSYDKYFGEDKDARQWRAAGLAIAQNLNGTWYQDQTMADILYAWQKDLASYRLEIDRWENTIDPTGALQAALQKVDEDRLALVNTITANKAFWADRLSYDQGLAHDLLAKIIANLEAIDDDPELEMMEEETANLMKLDLKRSQLLAVEQRLVELDKRLKDQHPTEQKASALDQFLASRKGTTPYNYLIAQIDDLAEDLKQLDADLALLEKKYATQSSRARDNAKPILQTTELATQLMFGLRSNSLDHKWMTKTELDSMMDGGLRQNIFLGLMTQRLSKVKNLQLFSPAGVARLIQLTVADLPTLPKYQDTDSTTFVDSLAFYHKASFVVNTLNRMLELPLLTSATNTREFTPLKDQIPGMAKVPDMANQTLDFVYYVNVKDHRHAVSSLLRLFDFLEEDVTRKNKDQIFSSKADMRSKGKSKRKPAIYYLQKYGDFIADLIDAEDGQQVEDLLNNIADPPGSSRIKRTQRMTVGLNAYLGANLGWERWSGTNITVQDEGYFGVSPNIPIGISISRLLGKKEQSFSLFLSFLDLGGLLTYRTNVDAFGEPVINFRNVFKPGVQIHYNIPKTPFYFALGGQYGPQILESGSTNVSLNTTRLFTGFGVDVPLKTLYQR